MKKIGQYIKDAKKALLNGSAGIKDFAVSYDNAIRDYGNDAYDEFRKTFPFFGKREWTRFGLVATGKLDPFFIFKSDSFICKLIRMKDPEKAQADIFSAAYDTCATSYEREKKVACLVSKINKSRARKSSRGIRAILDDLIDVVIELEGRRDDEWDFVEHHGIDSAFWSDDDDKEHDQILEDIKELRNKASRLVKEATGNDVSV